MNRTLLSLATAVTIVSGATLVPSQASALGMGAAAAIDLAVQDMNMMEDVRYVCRHRYHSSRRVCWWVPVRRYYRPHRYYRRWRYW